MTSDDAKAWAAAQMPAADALLAHDRVVQRFIERLTAAAPTGDGSAACVPRKPATGAQREYEALCCRRGGNLIGHEAFYYKWRSDGGVMP